MGFEEHGKVGILRGDGEEIVSAFTLLPERSAELCAATRKEKRTGGGFAEFRGEERRGAELANDEVLGYGGIGKEERRVGRVIDVRKTEDEAVVSGHGFDVGAGVLDLRGCGHGPGRVDAIAEGSKNADTPVAELVADTFDDDVAVVWNSGCYICLIGEELEEVFGGLGLEVVLADEAADGGVGR
jgi:hypothetical protein